NFQKYNGIFRWLRVGFWKIRGRLRALRQEDKKRVDYDELTADIQQAIERKEILNKLEEDNTQDYYRHFDSFFESGMPDLEAIENALKWLKELQQYPISSQAVAEIISADENLQQLRNLLLNLEKSINLIENGFKFLKKHFPQNRNTKANDWEKTNLKQVNNFIEEINKDLPNFQRFLDCQQKIKQLEAIGAKDFLSKLRQSKIPPQHWFPVLQKGVYQNWLEHIYSENPQLRTFDKNRHQQKIKQFCQRDTEQYQEAIKRLKQLHFERWKECKLKPEIITQEGILDQKSTAKRVNQKIRQFIKKVPQLATTLKPFWLMSPLAVSQYIDAEAINFDVVIFDEASQVCTEDAVPAIMRAKQVIVVGDNKQLPPSSFFKSGTSGDDDDDELETYESLLDECSTVLQKFTLKWHYRSKHESLIAFSNSQFYNSELLTFPNPVKDSNRGVHFRYVEDGIYARGTDRNNLPEAKVVAQIALEDFQKNQQNPDFSLGIVTLNEEQAATIREQINHLSINNPQFEEFFQEDSVRSFIKPLEKVQGDQQEVIIMSFGYGKDENGKIIYNFGLLTKPGGRRRLNVAITRARSKFVLVSSMKSTDFESSDNLERTVLRDYFAYAQNGGEVSTDINDDLSESDFMFEEDIYQALTQRGYKVKKKVGRSAYPIDLAVINNRQQETEEFLLGIVCDGTIYHKYPTSRERNRLRKTILENLGWNIYQIWSHEWFKNPQKQINQLVNHIENLQNKK
ncbi:MAG: AAA domain-containing protein, partial [Rivularia sp. (in: cyanobacteria)]